jgi:hypothetical protein
VTRISARVRGWHLGPQIGDNVDIDRAAAPRKRRSPAYGVETIRAEYMMRAVRYRQ